MPCFDLTRPIINLVHIGGSLCRDATGLSDNRDLALHANMKNSKSRTTRDEGKRVPW
jgi:hypothetical protein